MVTENDIGKEVYFISLIGIKKGFLLNDTTASFRDIYGYNHKYFKAGTNDDFHFVCEDEIFTSKRQIINYFLSDKIPQEKILCRSDIKNCTNLNDIERILANKPSYILTNDHRVKYGVVLSNNENRITRIYKFSEEAVYSILENDIIIPCFDFYNIKYGIREKVDIYGSKLFSTKEELIKDISRQIKEL